MGGAGRPAGFDLEVVSSINHQTVAVRVHLDLAACGGIHQYGDRFVGQPVAWQDHEGIVKAAFWIVFLLQVLKSGPQDSWVAEVVRGVLVKNLLSRRQFLVVQLQVVLGVERQNVALDRLGLTRQVPVGVAGRVEEGLRVGLAVEVDGDAVVIGQGVSNLDVFLAWEVVGGRIDTGSQDGLQLVAILLSFDLVELLSKTIGTAVEEIVAFVSWHTVRLPINIKVAASNSASNPADDPPGVEAAVFDVGDRRYRRRGGG